MIKISKSNPSKFGKFTGKIFDEYTLYKCQISNEIIEKYLKDKLTPFATISFKNTAKRDFFYSKPILFASRSQINDNFQELSSSITLENLFEELLSTKSDTIRYNFIITGDEIIFVEIPAIRHVTYHLLCKHITLANYSEDVRFAGELWKDEKNLFKLNNNSGTYKPSNYLIENAVQLFNQLTPNLQYQGISFEISLRPSAKDRFIYKFKNKSNIN